MVNPQYLAIGATRPELLGWHFDLHLMVVDTWFNEIWDSVAIIERLPADDVRAIRQAIALRAAWGVNPN